jgi:phosphatidylglycerophosphate synthase
MGKLSTLLQIVAIGIALLSAFCSISIVLLDSLFVVTGLVTGVACFHYIWGGLKVLPEEIDQDGE